MADAQHKPAKYLQLNHCRNLLVQLNPITISYHMKTNVCSNQIINTKRDLVGFALG